MNTAYVQPYLAFARDCEEIGDQDAQQCGWRKDRFGVSWQIAQKGMGGFLGHEDPAVNELVMAAMIPMKKLELASLRAAAAVSPDRSSVIRSTRTIPFPTETIFAALTDPERLERWSGNKEVG